MRYYTLAFALSLFSLNVVVSAADWPQWRGDAERSGVTEESLSDEMQLQWSLDLGRPAPAYAHQFRMCADYAYAPVAADGMLFVPSNVTDQVMAFDLETGRLLWRFIADGPVRFAPVYDQGRLYFASDDGYLYCIDARTGELNWRFRGVPDHLPDMRMLVNGRMLSRWPARGGPVLHNGKVFFGAGIWPEEGVYVNAVNAETGQLLWRSDALSIITEGMCDHGTNLDLSLPPHGYLTVIGDRLAVASGRTLAAFLHLETGELDPYTSFYVKKSNPRGTWYVAANDNFWVQGGNWFATQPEAVPPRPEGTRCPLSWSKKSPDSALFQLEKRPFLFADVNGLMGGEVFYSEPVLCEDTAYTSVFEHERDHLVLNGETVVRFKDFDRIVAWDLTKPTWKTRPGIVEGAPGIQNVSIIRFPVKWELKTPLSALIKTKTHLIAGGDNTIAAIGLPGKGEPPQITWQAEIVGRPINTLVSDGHLVTVTDTGKYLLFRHNAETTCS